MSLASRRRSAARYAIHRREANEVFLEYWLSSCTDCGEEDPLVMEIDHEHGASIFSGLRNAMSMSPDRIRSHLEVDCEPRCANCHTRRHRLEEHATAKV